VNTWVEIGKVLGPSVVALGGIYGTYRSGRGQNRVSRHHARIEPLYAEMLDSLHQRATEHLEFASALLGQRVLTAAGEQSEWPQVHDSRDLDIKVRLFAHKCVQAIWYEALRDLVDASEPLVLGAGRGEVPDGAKLMKVFSVHRERLANAMRKDLGVPAHRPKTLRARLTPWRRGDPDPADF
jgi:hypothetical protein